MLPFQRLIDTQIRLDMLLLEHVAEHYALLHKNRAHIGQWEDWVDYATYENQVNYVKDMMRSWEDGQGFTSGIWYRPIEELPYEMVGNISYRKTHRESQIELGYWLDRQCTGKGIATRAVRSLVDYALREAAMQQVLICAAVTNRASCAIPERLGFKLAAIMEDGIRIRGERFDQACYIMDAQRWRVRNWGAVE